MEFINWAITDIAEGGGGFTAPTTTSTPAPASRTVAEISDEVQQQVRADRPRRQAAIQGVRNAVLAGETDAQRRRREQAILKAQEQDAEERAMLEALEKEVESQTDRPPLTPDEWEAHIISIVAPSINYFNTRLSGPSGDRFQSAELFHGASLFDPSVAKGLTHDEAMEMLEKLRYYPALDQEGDRNIVDKLKKGWSAYHRNASGALSQFKYDDDSSAILSWHYQLSLRLDKELLHDRKRGNSCRYCGSRSRKCNCIHNLRSYWEAAQLLALVVPSSCAAERVFSLLNNQFNQQQTRTLSDMLYLSLYLSFNDR